MSQTFSQETINEFVVASHFDLPKVQSLLEEHPNLLNENAEWIETPIQAASHVANIEIIEYLLSQGAPLDICTAAVLHRIEDVKLMLDEAPGLKDAHGAHDLGVLFFAALVGDIEIAEILLTAGASVNPGGSQSPLIGAIIGGHLDMIRWLLARDADPYAVNFEGKSALEFAEEKGEQVAADLLRPYYTTE